MGLFMKHEDHPGQVHISRTHQSDSPIIAGCIQKSCPVLQKLKTNPDFPGRYQPFPVKQAWQEGSQKNSDLLYSPFFYKEFESFLEANGIDGWRVNGSNQVSDYFRSHPAFFAAPLRSEGALDSVFFTSSMTFSPSTPAVLKLLFAADLTSS